MSLQNQLPKRKRGVVLTLRGWQRLRDAQRQVEITENYGNPFTLEELSERTNLSFNTLSRIQRRQIAVDRHSLESYFKAFHLILDSSDYTKLKPSPVESRQNTTLKGQVPLNSPLYVERDPIERLCYETISQPGALIRIKAPRQMGKTSLMARIMEQARIQGLETVALSFQLADATILTDLTRFLQWFCAIVTRSLGLPNHLAEYWDEIFGSNYNCTDYFENYLLAKINNPIVLAIDEVDVVFNYPEIATDFFRLLQVWYEKAKYGDTGSEVWQKLRLVVVHSTEVYIPLNSSHSPFNVGLSIELPEFTLEQVEDLANRYQLNWTDEQVKQLMVLVGGNPYLVQIALHHLSDEDMQLNQLLAIASAEDGIYSDYLRQLLWNLKQYPDLMNAMSRIVRSSVPLKLEPVQWFKLQSMGLVRGHSSHARLSCDLYYQYFRDCLSRMPLHVFQESRLATIVYIGVVDCSAKTAADPERKDKILYQDFQRIIQLCQPFEGQVLKSSEDGLFIYFPTTLNAVNCAQEIQLSLRKAAELSSEPILTHRIGIHCGEVIFNYTDLVGTSANIATYAQAEAPPGGICISHAVYQAVQRYLALQPIEIGQQQLEGINEPICLYQLVL
ncbi:MAG TPA: AAA-like domain-containing protein [Waterburya sp.]